MGTVLFNKKPSPLGTLFNPPLQSGFKTTKRESCAVARSSRPQHDLNVVTIGDIRKGIEKLPPSKRRETVREWLEADFLLRFQGRILEITTEVMSVWGELARRLENEGNPITLNMLTPLFFFDNFIL